MSETGSEFHLGNLVKEELRRQGRSTTWLAGQLGCTRDNLYKIFNHSFMNTDLLFKISSALQHDFFKDCSAYLNVKSLKKNGTSVDK